MGSSQKCMNVLCDETGSTEWKRGWPLRSGQLATLCDKCGSAFEQATFCDVFHSKDSGWRECASCGKRLHCGCIASRMLLELLDCGGVNCASCAKSSGLLPITSDEKPSEFGMINVRTGELKSSTTDNHFDSDDVDKLKLIRLGSSTDDSGLGQSLLTQYNDTNRSLEPTNREGVMNLPSAVEMGSSCYLLSSKLSNGATHISQPDILKANIAAKEFDDPHARTDLSMTIGVPLGKSYPSLRDHSTTPSLSPQGPKSRHILHKPPKPALASGFEANAGVVSQIRVARPPAEGRGRNQLLPRYWPRITDQELQQISGDSNSTIVPLFEKVLSASDAGRIGRLVLPKACAEAYFPPISQPEGLPLRIQDVKGKEWVFQFRFWPNNNSRMYVLEGVTPCIQSMQLQAGDTVTFSRMDPEGKLIMGFRKASTSMMQDSQLAAVSNGNHSSEALISGGFENLPMISGYSGLLHSFKGSTDPQLNALSKHWSSASGDISWQGTEKHGLPRDAFLLPGMSASDRKKARNIGSKSKRLLIDSQDALELKMTWEELQDLLRPPPRINPSIVTVEDHEFEEYDEPPVFGKSSIFVLRSTGGQEQWVQCDSCGKWRRLPVDVLLPPSWTCEDNAWDQSRRSCSVPDGLTPRDLDNLLRLTKEFKKRKLATNFRPALEHESSGLDALANAAIVGDDGEPGTTSVATTTKHPRHRPGCSCIVCIQPPSGKGKHKPTCNCNVCMTVKRRFKTLMMRKKKRQSEREAEIAQRKQLWGSKDEIEVDSTSTHRSSHHNPSENESRIGNELESQSQTTNSANTIAETGKGQINLNCQLDLNCQPDRNEELRLGSSQTSMMNLLRVASQPLETYLKQNGLSSLMSEQQASPAGHAQLQGATTDNEGQHSEDHCADSEIQEMAVEKDGTDEKTSTPDQGEGDP
ncbi:hypothetical protein BT93_F3054 [Corymbia citriodora subsp. variegata]|nr:hypothetical protein BT93_F3054 [Corymbia citriodora subsp. variegata]